VAQRQKLPARRRAEGIAMLLMIEKHDANPATSFLIRYPI